MKNAYEYNKNLWVIIVGRGTRSDAMRLQALYGSQRNFLSIYSIQNYSAHRISTTDGFCLHQIVHELEALIIERERQRERGTREYHGYIGFQK